MLDKVLKEIRQKVQTLQYVVTLHAEEEMENEDLSIYDVESGILTGKVIERQKDKQTGERKYSVRGTSIDERMIEIIGKIGPSGILVIITVYTV